VLPGELAADVVIDDHDAPGGELRSVTS
jgi:hypothetical protein